jgi:hypothetical protein
MLGSWQELVLLVPHNIHLCQYNCSLSVLWRCLDSVQEKQKWKEVLSSFSSLEQASLCHVSWPNSIRTPGWLQLLAVHSSHQCISVKPPTELNRLWPNLWAFNQALHIPVPKTTSAQVKIMDKQLRSRIKINVATLTSKKSWGKQGPAFLLVLKDITTYKFSSILSQLMFCLILLQAQHV